MQPMTLYDHKVDSNSSIVIGKWIDNSIAHLSSNFAAIKPIQNI